VPAMKPTRILLLVGALALGAAWFALDLGADRAARALDGVHGGPVAHDPDGNVLELSAAGGRAAVASSEQRDQQPASPDQLMGDGPATEPRDAVTDDSAVQLDGAAIRVRDGVEHTADDGAFELLWHRAGESVRRPVAVTRGSWSATVPRDVRLYVHGLVLGGAAILLENDDYGVPADRFLVLRGEERRDVLLHVRSGATGSALDGVEVWPGPYGFSTEARHPGAEPEGTAIVSGAPSPVRIPPPSSAWSSAVPYLVRAPGHAFGVIDIDHAAGGERELVLPLAASLEVELIGNAEWLAPEVRLWPPDASEHDAYAYAKRRPDASGRARFESLAPGAYVASVERGWADRRVSYGRAEVLIVAGERAHVLIPVELPARPQAVRVAGTLTVPNAWSDVRLVFSCGAEDSVAAIWMDEPLTWPIESFEALASAPPGVTRREYVLELPSAGTYHLEVTPLPVRLLLEVPAEGLTGVDIVIPPPADVEVRVVDARTGKEVQVESLHWSAARVEGIRATTLHNAVVDPERGRVRFRVPAGAIVVSPRDPALETVEKPATFLVQAGHNPIDLRVWRRIGVRFKFMDGEAQVPWDWNWSLSAHRTDGGARDIARSIGTLWFRDPGTYELKSQGIPGYQSIDGTRIEVPDTPGIIDFELPLARE
jgi:hypothetical protein